MSRTVSSTSLLKSLSLSLMLLVAACGFHPVYGKGDGNVSEQLASVKIEKIHSDAGDKTDDHEGQILQNTLEDLLNPDATVVVEKKYTLTLSLKNTRREVGINTDLRVTRYDVVPTVEYALIEIGTNKVVDAGKINIKSSYNRTTSEFATYVAQQNATQLADRELAEEVRSRLIYFFSK